MSLPSHLLIHTVARIRPSVTTDGHGNQKRDYTVPPATSTTWQGNTADGAWLQQDNRKEPLSDGRDPQEQIWLMMTNQTDVNSYDRIVFGSMVFEVDGPPAPVYTKSGFHHTEATLRLVSG